MHKAQRHTGGEVTRWQHRSFRWVCVNGIKVEILYVDTVRAYCTLYCTVSQ